jgi:hypothetical protein
MHADSASLTVATEAAAAAAAAAAAVNTIARCHRSHPLSIKVSLIWKFLTARTATYVAIEVGRGGSFVLIETLFSEALSATDNWQAKNTASVHRSQINAPSNCHATSSQE